jgi:hypothetical protein
VTILEITEHVIVSPQHHLHNLQLLHLTVVLVESLVQHFELLDEVVALLADVGEGEVNPRYLDILERVRRGDRLEIVGECRVRVAFE